MATKICATSPIQAEFSLCGDAFDAPETEGTEPFEMAKLGQVVNCEKCKLIIRTLRAEYPRGFKYHGF